jgi:AbrB family looped-hinge helix DNA binding protein
MHIQAAWVTARGRVQLSRSGTTSTRVRAARVVLLSTPPGWGGLSSLAYTVKEMAKISGKNQITIPVAVLQEVGLHAGDQVVVEALEDGELRIRRGTVSFERAFGALTGVYPAGYLEQLHREDAQW